MITIRELASLYANKQPQQVDYITESAPILNTALFQESTHGLRHSYEEVEDVTGATFVDMDAPLSTVDSITALRWVDLSILGGIHEAGEDLIKQFGDFATYLARKEQSIMRKSGQNAESQLIYNQFETYAKAQSKLQSATAVPSGDIYYSMYAVRWQEGNFSGLFNPGGFGRGALLEPEFIAGGNIYKDATNRLVRGVRWKTYLGFLLANARNIAGIVNINLTSLPTDFASKIDKMLASARVGDGGSIYIYCHQNVLTALAQYKADRLQVMNADTGLNRLINSWNGVQIVPSYNFLEGTESAITI